MTLPLLLQLLVGGLVLAVVARAVRTTVQLRRISDAVTREHDMVRVADYFAAETTRPGALPARAWSDLDLDEVFRKVDRTASWPGQHLLYARLRREDHSKEELDRFETALQRLATDADLGERIRRTVEPLDEKRASVLPYLFQGDLPATPPLARLFPVLSAVSVLCLVAVFWWPPLLVGVVALAVTNVYIRVVTREKVERVIPAMRMLPAVLRAATTLSAIDAPELAVHAGTLREVVPRLQWIARAARWLSFDTSSNELAGYIYEYLNILFLLDVTTFAWSIDAIRIERDALSRAYAAIGEMDCLQSVAAWRNERRDWTSPVFSTGADCALTFSALSHPFLGDAAIPNSLDTGARSVLLTGSNMSGKSTFIRAVGVNAVLAQSIHTVFATAWTSPRFAVRTSIGRADSLVEGKSYYRAEVDAVGALLALGDDRPHLVLIDELFRGTNSIERVAAAKAVLAQLDRPGNTVIIATHDIELLELLPSYSAYHFREEVRDGELTFDYKLHAGPSSTKNAIAILELAGYPASVVEEARTVAMRMEQHALGRARAPS